MITVRKAWIAAAIAAGTVVATTLSVVAGAATGPTTLWPSTATPVVASDPDANAVEVGTKFSADVAGVVTGVRYYRGSTANGGTHVGSLWSPSGTRLAHATFTSETASGWQQVTFAAVRILAGQTYTVSYHAPVGRYAGDANYFAAPYSRGVLHAPVSAGVYHYGSTIAYPTSTYQASNYWVDVVFTPDTQPSPSASASPTGSPTPSPSPTGPPGVLNLPRVPWEGGPAYYAGKPAATAWADPTFFPIGVWEESITGAIDVTTDKAAGLNTYVEMTDNSDPSLARAQGMSIVKGGLAGEGSETVGDMLGDEGDMILGAGNDGWNGTWGWNTCIPIQDNGGRCGYTAMAQVLQQSNPANGRLKYTNYGKGVMMWDTDTQAAQFVNGYTSLLSADMYFYTDTNLCAGESESWLGIPTADCRMAANYGFTMDKLRRFDGMDSARQPIFGFVEVGHPAGEDTSPTITPAQVQGAVMSSIIHEARGIIYFNHSFGGPCPTQHALRETCYAATRSAVIQVNGQLHDLAPVLNTQSYQWSFGPGLDTVLKQATDGSFYVIAMQSRPGRTGTYTFTMPPGMAGTVTAPYESRTIATSGGTWTDSFAAESAYHIYKVTP